jgi:hypothetical protein
MTYNPEWRAADEQRVVTLEQLYIEAGRQDPKHPSHMLYTGLWQQHLENQQCPT